MAGLKVTDQQVIAALAATKGNRSAAGRMLGVHVRTILERINRLQASGIAIPDNASHRPVGAEGVAVQAPKADIEIPKLPSGKIDIRELIDRRKAGFARRDEFAQARKLIPIKIKSNLPIGITLIGDPHVDDDGTDLAALERDIQVIKSTDGLYAACIGDVQNNWVGRLARLYAYQETTAGQSWQLVEWFVEELAGHWLFMVQGNHDHWSGSGDPLRWIQKQAGVDLTGDHTVRLALRFPNGSEIRVAARHDWPGQSMWNPSHGQLRAASLTHHDHIIVSGHKHTGGYQMIRVPASGLLAHCIQLGSYKRHDDYADALGCPDRLISPSATVIIDPTATDLGAVRVEHDTEAAADYLTWLRQRRAA